MSRRRIVRRRGTNKSNDRGAQLRLLLGTLQRLTSDHWTVDELAEDLAVHRRTIWRVLAAIRGQCPLECAREHRVSYYRLPRRWYE